MKRVGVITQARSTSTRLPRKVLLDIGGRSMLDHHLDRLSASGLPVIVATTTNSSDDEIVALCDRRGVPSFRGSESDVLSRYLGCAQHEQLEVIVRVTSDCPLIDGVIIAEAVRHYLAADDPWLYLSNTLKRTFPRGMDYEVFSARALAGAHAHAVDPADREHVTPYLYANGTGRMRLENLGAPADWSGYRLTVDTAQDLLLMRRLIEDHGADALSVEQIVALLDAHPELAQINMSVRQKRLGD